MVTLTFVFWVLLKREKLPWMSPPLKVKTIAIAPNVMEVVARVPCQIIWPQDGEGNRVPNKMICCICLVFALVRSRTLGCDKPRSSHKPRLKDKEKGSLWEWWEGLFLFGVITNIFFRFGSHISPLSFSPLYPPIRYLTVNFMENFLLYLYQRTFILVEQSWRLHFHAMCSYEIWCVSVTLRLWLYPVGTMHNFQLLVFWCLWTTLFIKICSVFLWCLINAPIGILVANWSSGGQDGWRLARSSTTATKSWSRVEETS